MYFYLSIFTVAFTTIFGLIHSQTARENLHLQSLYEWFEETIKYYFSFTNFFDNPRNTESNPLINILNNIANEIESPNSLKNQWIDSVEEINLVDQDSIASSNDSLHNERRNIATSEGMSEDHDVFEAINAALRRLSSTANSVKINGDELYNLIIHQLVLHHKAGSNRPTETTSVQGPSSEATIEVQEIETQNVEESKKPKLYFGESPLEYVPHQK